MSSSKLAALAAYSACDISDALLKLEVPGAGYLADIAPIPNPQSTTAASTAQTKTIAPASTAQTKTIAPASTVLFTHSSTPSFPSPQSSFSASSILSTTFSLPSPNIPKNMHWADMTLPGSIAVLSQPDGQACACVSGVVATRMAVKGVRGVVVAGRVRELARLRAVVNGKADVGPEPAEWRAGVPIMEPTQPGNNSSGRKEGMPIWSRGTSVVGMKAEAKPWAVNVPVRIGQVEVFPGDVVMLDHAERGAVCVPAMLVDKVLDMLPRVAEGETKMLQHVEAGGTVSDAGRMYRGK